MAEYSFSLFNVRALFSQVQSAPEASCNPNSIWGRSPTPHIYVLHRALNSSRYGGLADKVFFRCCFGLGRQLALQIIYCYPRMRGVTSCEPNLLEEIYEVRAPSDSIQLPVILDFFETHI